MCKKTVVAGVVFLGLMLLSSVVADAALWTDPYSFNAYLTEGCSGTLVMIIGNDGPDVLNFTVRTHIVGGSGSESLGIDRLSAAGKAAASSGVESRDFTVLSDVPHKPDELIVRFAPKAGGRQLNTEEKHNVLSSLASGVRIKREFKIVPGLSVVKLPAGMTIEKALQTLNKTSGILYAHPNYQVQALSTFPNDTRFSELWGMHNTGQTGGTPDADIGAPEAWDIGTGSKDIIVAVIDTGVDYTHPDLAQNMWVNQPELSGITGVDDDGNGYIDDIYGYDFCNDDGDPMDDHYHGTHCAGTIGAVGNNNQGVAGVCWNVKIMALKFLNSGGSGTTADAIECVEYSVLMGANLSSNSWGGGGYDQGLEDAIDAAGAAGMLFVAAAGNYNENADISPLYPAAYDCPSIISVMATDHTDQKSSFSNYGPISVDLGAPGSNILSCQPGGGYQYLNGTSMATPHVSGACALLWSMSSALSGSEVKDILLRTVDPTLAGLCVSGGRLNLYKAICETKVPWMRIEPNEGTIGPGESVDINVIFDAVELAPGVYQAEIVITSNDPCSSAVVPVTMTVKQDDLVVTPAEGFESSGVKGGPFEPTCKRYTLTNGGISPVNWTTLATEDWLTMMPPAGLLEPGVSVDVNVCINTNANLLDPNVYSQVLTFQNLESGSIKSRSVVLTVKPPDLFTELFEAGGDFTGLSLTFRPNGSIGCYEACRDEVNAFPTDPNGGTYLPLADDDFAEVVLADGKEILFYGQSYDRFYVGSNGYITFGTGDTQYGGSLENHFGLPRISGYFADLTPANSQSISFRQLEDRVAVTFNGVPIYGDKTAKNSFQIEMFFGDGSIRVTWLELTSVAGVAGLSEGKGLPPAFFIESDLSAYPICWPLGDFSKDYVVDLADLGIFVSFWLNEDCSYPLWCDRTDLDFSSDVEGIDFSIFARNWGVVKSTMPPPIAYWKFDEGTGTVAYDSAGHNDGNLVNGPTWTTGYIDGGLSFDGVNDYVYVPDSEDLDVSVAFTFAFWMYINQGALPIEHIISKDGSSDTTGAYNVYVLPDKSVEYEANNKFPYFNSGANSISQGVWDHVAITFDGSTSPSMIIYIDGVEKASGSPPAPSILSTYLMIGRRGLSSDPRCFGGKLDDVRIYNLALSAEEIWQLYREGLSYKAFNPKPADGQTGVDPNVVLSWSPGKDAETHDVYFGTDFEEVNDADIYDPDVYMGNQDANHWDVNNYDSNGLEPDTTFYWRIDEVGTAGTTKGDVWSFQTCAEPNLWFGLAAWWKFDEGTGAIAYDSAGNNDGTIYGATWTTGKIDGALSFDGTNDYVDCGSGPSNYDNITVSAWMKTSTEGILVSNRYSSYSYGTWYTLSSMDIELGDNSQGGYKHLNFNTPTLNGIWHHIAYTKDGINNAVYVDGSLDLSFTSNADISWNVPTFIGRRWTKSSGDGVWFNGTIDDVRIYDRALTANEVWQLYQNGL